jgi:hypothetical protein
MLCTYGAAQFGYGSFSSPELTQLQCQRLGLLKPRVARLSKEQIDGTSLSRYVHDHHNAQYREAEQFTKRYSKARRHSYEK